MARPYPVEYVVILSDVPSLPFHIKSYRPALTQNHLQRYVRTFASLHEINSNDNSPNTSYNTRVERVDKRFDVNGREVGWTLTLRKFIETGLTSYKIQWWTEVGTSCILLDVSSAST